MNRQIMTPNVLLLSIDSLRPEAIGAYPRPFAPRDTWPFRVSTPTLDALAARGTLFTSLIVQAPYTPASHASYLTGLNPPSHGVQGFFGYELNPRAVSLTERLKSYGYRTAAFVGADALHPNYGLNRGFDAYDNRFEKKLDIWVQGQHRRIGSEATERAISWLEDTSDPFFCFVHYFDVHGIADHIFERNDRFIRSLRRLRRSGMLKGSFNRWIRRFENEYVACRREGKPFHVRQAQRIDRWIGRILTTLEGRRQLDNTIIAVISDHGDAFGEHGEYGHRRFLYDTTLKVPMILAGPGITSSLRVDETIRSIDLAPTLCDLLNIDDRAGHHLPMEGSSLLPLIEADSKADHRVAREAYSETRMETSLEDVTDLSSQLISWRTPQWKLIVDLLNDARELYRIDSDPDETCDVADFHTDIADDLERKARATFDRRTHEPAPVGICSEDDRRAVEARLRDLGYL